MPWPNCQIPLTGPGTSEMPLPSGKALRTVFGETMAELANDDPRILVLDGDVGSSTGAELFEVAHPDRYLQMGIAEQNMFGVAAGLATLGFIPIASSFACFVVARALDSIRVLIAQPRLNVKIVGGYTGLLTGMTGKTHQIFNDVAIMRTLTNMVVLAPADEAEARQALQKMVSVDGPVYIQTTREPSPVLFGSRLPVRNRPFCENTRRARRYPGEHRRPNDPGLRSGRYLGRPGHRIYRPARPDDQTDRRGGYRPGRPRQPTCGGDRGPERAGWARRRCVRSAVRALPHLGQTARHPGRVRRKWGQRRPSRKISFVPVGRRT